MTRKGKFIIFSATGCGMVIFLGAVFCFMVLQREMTVPTDADKNTAILYAAGIIETEFTDEKTIESLWQQYIIPRRVNLDSAQLVDEEHAVEQECASLTNERDPAQIRLRCVMADIYFVKDKSNKIQQIIIPVFGRGAKSMMHAFLALEPDGRTVKNLYYYQQRETPLLGARVEDENWRRKWVGKKILDSNGNPALKIIQKKPQHPDEYTVDGISGATLTSRGVENSIRYWVGEQGFGPFLKRLSDEPDIFTR